jgi:flagellar motility protein MotE (MotC chaperone)
MRRLRHGLINVKIFVAILLIAAVPAYAQTQSRSTPKTGDAQKAVTIISGDKAKIQAYCDIQKLALQIEEASKKKDHGKTVNELYQKIRTLEETIGPEYVAWIDGLPDIAKDDQLAAEFVRAITALDRLCAN